MGWLTMAAAAGLLAAGFAASAVGSERGVLLRDGDRFRAEIGPADEDRFDLDLAEGGWVALDVRPGRTSELLPVVRLFAPDGHEELLTPADRSRARSPRVRTKRFQVPPGGTGRWCAVVSGAAETTGRYWISARVRTPRIVRARVVLSGSGVPGQVDFTGADDARVDARVRFPEGGPDPVGIRLLAPDGSLLFGDADFEVRPHALRARGLALRSGFGRYLLELPVTGTPAEFEVAVKVRLPAVEPRRTVLPSELVLAEAAPGRLPQESTRLELRVSGNGFLPGTAAEVTGAGVHVRAVEVLDVSTALVHLDVDADATYGPRDLLLHPPALFGESVRLPGAVTVTAPPPRVTAIAPASLRQLEPGAQVTLTGNGFRPGCTVSVAGGGLTVGATEFVSTNQLRVEVGVARDAPVGPRDLTVTQSAEAGGDATAVPGAVAIHHPVPVLASASPGVLRQGESGLVVRLLGDHFRDGAVVTPSGTGVEVVETERVSDTELRVTVDVAADATYGTRQLTYMQPAAGGGDSAALHPAFEVHAPDPTVASISPASIKQLDQATLTVRGTGFRPGAAIAFSGGGLGLGATEFVSETELRVPVAAAADAPANPRDVRVVQPAQGGGAAAVLADALDVRFPDPTLSGVAPAVVRQEDRRVLLTLSGTRFRRGGTVSVSGDGLTLGLPRQVSDSTFEVLVGVAPDATYGPRDLTYHQPEGGGGASVTLPGALTVNAPDPVVTSVGPAVVKQLDAGLTLTVRGTGFRDGCALSLSGSGLTWGATKFVSPTEATLAVTAAIDAPVGPRDLTLTQPLAGGGAADTLPASVAVHHPDPVVLSVAPAVARQEDQGLVMTVSGHHFRDGGQVSVNGAGVSVTSAARVDDDTFRLTLDVESDAPYGPRDLTYTQPLVGGGASATAAAAFEVHAPAPRITSVSPTVLKQLGRQVITVDGARFRPNCVVSVSGTGLTAGATTYVSPTRATVEVVAAADAPVGLRDVTIVQSDEGGGASATAVAALAIHHPDPVLSSVSPAIAKQEAAGLVLTLTGNHFRDGGTVSVNGSGVTLSAAHRVSDTTYRVTLDVAADAPYGPRTLSYAQPAAGGGASVSLAGAFTVHAPDPTVAAVGPTVLRQLDQAALVTVHGTGFRPGCSVSVSGGGVSFGAVTYVSATEIQVRADVTNDAPVGTRSLTVTQPAAGGGASATLSGALAIHHPDPVLSSVSPGVAKQEDAARVLTLAGSHFRAGGSVAVSGTGVSVGATQWISDQSFRVTLAVDADAPYGARDLTYVQPASGGGAAVTLASAFAVHAPDPVVASVSPGIVKQLDAGTVLTIDGTGFRPGATVSVAGAGVLVGPTTFVSKTRLTVTIDVLHDAAVGPRAVSVTHSVAAGGATGTSSAALTVHHPDPVLHSAVPGVLRQEDTGVVLTLSGAHFRAGGTVSVSGTGVTLTNFTWISDTTFRATAAAAADAAYGPRSLTYTQPAAGGGASVTLENALGVRAPDPVLTAISPGAAKQEDTGLVLTLTGDRFRDGGTVTVSGWGVTASNPKRVSATSFQVTLSVAAGAPYGARSVTYAQPAAGGGASATLTGALTVRAPDPAIASVSPSVVRQEASGVVLTLDGARFRDGGQVSVSGSGVTLSNAQWISDTQFRVTLDVAADAPYGARSVTYTQPAAGGGASVTLAGAFSVHAPVPAITSVSPAVLVQNDVRTLTVDGTGFRSGCAISVSGTGLTLGATTYVSPTRATVEVSVAALATVGARDVTITQSSAAGGASATSAGGLTIHHPPPVLTSVTPSVVRQEESARVVTLAGDHFRTGATVAVSGSGVTVSGTRRVSDTSFEVTLAVAADAPYGTRSLTYTQPAAGGGAAATLTGALTVNAPDPVVSSASPAAVVQGAGATTVRVLGTGFRSGGTLAISGTGLTVGTVTFVSSTEVRVPVTAASAATLGARDVTWTQPAAGGGAAGTGTGVLSVHAPTPTVTAVSPTALTQGASSVTLTVTGTNFRTGGAISISGTGLTVGTTTVGSATSATVSVTVASGAPVGTRDVTFTQPAAGGGASGTGSGLLAIHHPSPTLTSVSPTLLTAGTSGTLTLTGTNFRSGGTVTTSGTGVTLSSPTYVSDTQFRASYSVSSAAATGFRDVTYAQPAAGGGASATKTSAYEVTQAAQFTSLTPSVIVPGAPRGSARLVGQGFNSGMTASVSGTGVTVHSTTFVSSTTLDLEVSAASSATVGLRNLTLTPASGTATTFSNVVAIAPADPAVLSVDTATIAQGTSVQVTVTGANFRSGDTLSASGTGVTFGTTTLTGTTTLKATATVTSTAALGARALTVTHSTADGGRSGTLADAFSVTGATPTVVAITPASVGRTGSGGAARTVPIRVSGTNFVTGATLSMSRTGGTGLTLVGGTTSVVSSTLITAELSVAGATTTGLWDVKVTNPGTLGNSGTTGNGLLDVKDKTVLAVNRVRPASGSTWGGERVTIEGSGFVDGCTVDFGAVRASGTQILDANTLVTTVPAPASASRTGPTAVDVKVTPPTGTAVTLTAGYEYAQDVARFLTVKTYPAQGATGVPANLRSAVVVLSAPADTTTGTYGTTTGTNTFWFEAGGAFVGSGTRGFGGGGRHLVLSRTSTGNLPIASGGLYVLDVPTALASLSGAAFVPTRLASTGNHDQQTFTIAATTTDTTAPTLTSISPTHGSTAQSTTTQIVLVFSEELDPVAATSGTITLKQGTTAVPAALVLGDDLRTVTLTPDNELGNGLTYTVTVTSGVVDLCGNAFTTLSRTFTTGGTTDSTSPVVDRVTIERLPSTVDGSGTYVNAAGTSGTAFDLYLPRHGWLIEVEYSDQGGAGIDATSFSAKCSVAVGSSSANAELATNFTVTPAKASWRIPSTAAVTAGENVTFTFSVKDLQGNGSATHTITLDVVDADSSAQNGGDHDPLDARGTWVLRTDLDAYTATITSRTTPSKQQGATTTVASNGVADLDEALELIGLGTASMTAESAAVVNGLDRGTNAVVRRLFAERYRELLRERFGIDQDGTHGPDAVDLEFLLPGEQGSLSSLPSHSTANSSNSSNGFSEISLGGTKGAETNAWSASGTLAQAWYDARNLRQEANLNTGTGTYTGVYLLGMFKLQVNTNALFKSKISSKLVTVHGGTPVGEGADDDDVLSASFDRTTSTDATRNARYDDIMDAIEHAALYASAVTAHEIGHSLGLVEDVGPKTGLFGAAHASNAFTEATSTLPNTSGHLDFLGNDLLAAATNFDSTTWTGADFKRLSPLDLAWLLGRLVYDEGK